MNIENEITRLRVMAQIAEGLGAEHEAAAYRRKLLILLAQVD